MEHSRVLAKVSIDWYTSPQSQLPDISFSLNPYEGVLRFIVGSGLWIPLGVFTIVYAVYEARWKHLPYFHFCEDLIAYWR